MKLGIVGLPNVGKSTLFNALTNNKALAENYPFCTIEPNVGTVAVKDERVDALTKLSNSKKSTYSTIEFVDIAGLVKGASKGEGLGNKFLSHIREVDAIVHVVRCFQNQNITHVNSSLNPVDDIQTITMELLFADIETLNRRIDKAKIAAKSHNKRLLWELAVLEKTLAFLGNGTPARIAPFNTEEKDFVHTLSLLTNKPIIYCANVGETKDHNLVEDIKKYAQQENSRVIELCVNLEEELAHLNKEERLLFYDEFGIEESGLDILVKECYSLLNLISFLTTGPTESRAWRIKQGTKAPQAAGSIHSDFLKGFIRALVISFDTLLQYGSFATAKNKGSLRSEGKDYIIKDGDVVEFLFNV